MWISRKRFEEVEERVELLEMEKEKLVEIIQSVRNILEGREPILQRPQTEKRYDELRIKYRDNVPLFFDGL